MGLAMGADFSGVRVHTDGRADELNSKLQAKAFTKGKDLFFKKGEYQPGKRDGQELIAHELTHVIQQKGKLNDKQIDSRQLECTKMSLKRTNNTEGKQEKEIGKRNVGEARIQRAVGLEIETGNLGAYKPKWTHWFTLFGWHVRKAEAAERITNVHMKLYEESGFRIETELSGRLEFVIEPPVETWAEMLEVMTRVQKVASSLAEANTTRKKVVRLDYITYVDANPEQVAGWEYMTENQKREEFTTEEGTVNLEEVLSNGDVFHPEVLISRMGTVDGNFQATVGIDLETMDQMMQEADLLIRQQEARDKDLIDNVAEIIKTHKKQDPIMSKKKEGLLRMVYFYIYFGRARMGGNMPKGQLAFMARTNFAKMFSMMDEAISYCENQDSWPREVLGILTQFNIQGSERVLTERYGGVEIEVAISDWLQRMVGREGKMGTDLLSKAGGGPAILKTMGNLQNKTDSDRTPHLPSQLGWCVIKAPYKSFMMAIALTKSRSLSFLLDGSLCVLLGVLGPLHPHRKNISSADATNIQEYRPHH